jgi:hypothetical protein
VKAGRAGCAASFRPRVSPPPGAKKTCKKKRQNKKRRRGKGKGGKPDAATDGAVTVGPGCCSAVELASGKPEVELPAVGLLVNSGGTGGKRQFRSDKGKRDVGDSTAGTDGGKDEAADGGGEKRPPRPPQKRKLAVGDGLPVADGRKEKQAGGDSMTFVDWRVQLADLDVGGQYKIPKKRKKND